MDKWNAVKAEALEEEEMLAEEVRPRSVEEIGHAKKQRIADWQKGQLDRAGPDAGETNANFQPVGDWRDRVAKARQKKALMRRFENKQRKLEQSREQRSAMAEKYGIRRAGS